MAKTDQVNSEETKKRCFLTLRVVIDRPTLSNINIDGSRVISSSIGICTKNLLKTNNNIIRPGPTQRQKYSANLVRLSFVTNVETIVRSIEKFSFWSKQKVVVKIPKFKNKKRWRNGQRIKEKSTRLVFNTTIYISFWLCRKITVMILWFSPFFVISPPQFFLFFPFAPFIFHWKCSQVSDSFYLILIHFERSVFLFQWMFCYSYFPLFWSL